MAITITRRDMNLVGNRVEDNFEVSMEAGDTEKRVDTRLYWIEHVDISCRSGEELQVNVYKNATGVSTAEGAPGSMFFDNANAGSTSCTYYFRVLGH